MEQIQTEHGIFTNNEETGQTAQEVYDEWLVNRDRPQPITESERIANAEQAINDLIMTIMMGGM